VADVQSTVSLGATVREWRTRRRMSQLELALETGISARHLSFVETGRSKPGRDMLVRIVEQLDVPLRERNELLLSAGYAPAFAEHSLDDPELAAVRRALEHALARHEPYPAMVVDRRWNIVAANKGMTRLTEIVDLDRALLVPPVNALRIAFHPHGMAPSIVNLADWRTHFLERLQHQLTLSADPAVAELIDEVLGYPAPAHDAAIAQAGARPPLSPVIIRTRSQDELSFFGMFAGFDTPFEVTTSELGVELLFPADNATAASLNRGRD
jgi:transcriptional regulator with XRE-family HTH domain